MSGFQTCALPFYRVRSADVVQFTEVENVELFPNISIGDAPVLEDLPAVSVSDTAGSNSGSSNTASAKQAISQ